MEEDKDIQIYDYVCVIIGVVVVAQLIWLITFNLFTKIRHT